jgi:glycosyltransferase involved in cell wall biosynthesis
MSIRFAHAVLTPNRAFRELFIQRGSPPDKIHIVMNSPQEDIFQPADTLADGLHDGFIIMYHGTIAERNGLGFALDAIDRLRATIEKLQFVVYGEGDYLDRFLAKIEELKLSDCVSYRGHVSLETIAREIPSADIGLIPNIRSPFTELNLPTRIFEYLAVGRPVIAPRTKGILDYFDDKSLFLFEPGEVQSLVECISAVYSDHKRLEQVYVAGGKIYQNYRWELQSKHFTQIVHNILAE